MASFVPRRKHFGTRRSLTLLLMQRRTVMLLAGSTLFAFALLASQVVTNAYLAATADPAVTRWLAERRTAGLTYFFLAVSAMHSTLGIDVMLGIVAVHRGIVRREWPSALWLVAAVQSSMLLNVGLKMAFARHRPVFAEPLVDLTTYSFPSGHALASTVLWGCVWLLLPRGADTSRAGHSWSSWRPCACRAFIWAPTSSPTSSPAPLRESSASPQGRWCGQPRTAGCRSRPPRRCASPCGRCAPQRFELHTTAPSFGDERPTCP